MSINKETTPAIILMAQYMLFLFSTTNNPTSKNGPVWEGEEEGWVGDARDEEDGTRDQGRVSPLLAPHRPHRGRPRGGEL